MKTDYQLSTTFNEGIIEIILTGEVTKATADGLQDEVLSIVKANAGKGLLVDCRALTGRLGIVDAFHRLRSIPVDLPKMLTAVVDTEDNSTFQSFQETTARNAGLPLQWFTDINAARSWLKGR